MFFEILKKVLRVGGVGLFAILVLIASCNAGIYFATKDNRYDYIASAPYAEVVLIPGAAVSLDGELSPIFLDRVNTAIKLYVAGKAKKILVSGDNSTDSYNEVNPVRIYLINQGIPEGDIFLDHAGFDTYSSMYRARDIFGVTSVIISTQSFHLPRAVFIANRLGLNATGINADIGYVYKKNYVRESLANVKAILDLLFGKQPKFLGEPIPITGDKPSL